MNLSTTEHIPPKKRVIAYIDGFNLFYGIKHYAQKRDQHAASQGKPPSALIGRSLYWLNIHPFISSCIYGQEQLVTARYFTAHRVLHNKLTDPDARAQQKASNDRQRFYTDALSLQECTEVELGKYGKDGTTTCEHCEVVSPAYEEKQTDVAIGVRMVDDAHRGLLDVCALITGDADLIPAVRVVQELGIPVRVMAPALEGASRTLIKLADDSMQLPLDRIPDHQLPDPVLRPSGKRIIRPAMWCASDCWISTDPTTDAEPPPQITS